MDPHRWQRVKETFGRVVDEPATRWPALLDELCAGDPALRREVVSLLEAEDQTNRFLVVDSLETSPRAQVDAGRYAGQRLGPYRIIREIGRGGMGAVFLAERADGSFDRQVAIKVVRRSLAEPELERRFLRERQILASLNHPNIAHLLDGGVGDEGDPFLVMEYIEGTRVDEYCARLSLPLRPRLELSVSICRAVAYAHDQLVIHRDLKPSNILVTAAGVPKLLDFGIAKLLDVGGREQTVTGYRVFTPEYAAPEQIRGEPATMATDVHGLGVLIAQLLDVTPWPRGGDRGAAPATVPRALRDILDTACRPEPERRYRSASALADDIERYLAGKPIAAAREARRYRGATIVRRRGPQLAAGAAAVLLLAAIGGGLTMGVGPGAGTSGNGAGATAPPASASPLADVTRIAVLPLRPLPGPPSEPGAARIDDQALRLGIADALVTKLSSVRRLAVRPMSATVSYLDRDYDAIAVGRDLHVDAVLDGTLQRVGRELRISLRVVRVSTGTVLWADSLTSDLEAVLRGQQSLANRVGLRLSVGAADAASAAGSPRGPTNLEAQDAFLRGGLALATSVRQIANILAARDAFEQAIRLDPEFAGAHAGLANAYTAAGSLNLLSPRDAYPKAERAAHRALALDPDQASAYIALGEVEADYNWNWAAAEATLERALSLAPNSAQAHQIYSQFLARMGRFAEAAAHADRSLDLDPTRVNSVAVRALHYYYEHRFADAVAQSERALAQDPTTYLALLYMSVAQGARGNAAAGLAAGERARALTGGAAPDLFVLACNYALMDDRPAASRMLQRLEALGRSRYVDPFFFVAVYAYLGEHDRAFEYMERAYVERSYWITTLRVHPVVDPLRADPRLDAMVRRMGLD